MLLHKGPEASRWMASLSVWRSEKEVSLRGKPPQIMSNHPVHQSVAISGGLESGLLRFVPFTKHLQLL